MNAMTANELDRLFENATDRLIEEVFGALDAENSNYGLAIEKLKEARRLIYRATGNLAAAAELVEGTIAEPRIMDLVDCAEECSDNITRQIDRME